VISRGVVSDVFGMDVIVVPADALPAPLEPMRSILTEVGLPAGLLDAVETLAGLTTGVMTYGEHCDEAGCVAPDAARDMFWIAFAGPAHVLLCPATGRIHYMIPEVGTPRLVSTSLAKYVEALCLIEQDRENFDFLDDDEVSARCAELAALLRRMDPDVWEREEASGFWRWVIQQVTAEEYRVY
jgi:SUKH-4 immunity protein of toxin-antitoxin system